MEQKTKINALEAVDFYFRKPGKWQKETQYLRRVVRDCGLSEELKWGCPCYTFGEANIVLIHEFKDYCALLFFKGALLKDSHNILVRQTKNVQAARQIRFTGVSEVVEQEPVLKAYIHEAVEVEKAGLKVDFKSVSEFPVAEEFQRALDENPNLKNAFEDLTPGRRRAYLLYFSAAKQSKTRQSRVDKYLAHILSRKGLDDQ